MDTLAFIARYEEILKDKRIPKMQFYKECRVSDAAVSQWRKGKTNPSMTNINAIAKYLGVSSEYLLTGQKEKSPAPDGVGLSKERIQMLLEQMSSEDLSSLIADAALMLAKRDAGK